MNKKIFTLLLLVFVLISVSAVSSADLNDTDTALAVSDNSDIVAAPANNNSDVLGISENQDTLQVPDSGDDVLGVGTHFYKFQCPSTVVQGDTSQHLFFAVEDAQYRELYGETIWLNVDGVDTLSTTVYDWGGSFSLGSLSVGQHDVKCVYKGGGQYDPCESQSQTVTVTVSKVPTEISIANATVDMEVNDEVATGAALTPADAGNVTYTVSNSSVVKVEDGKIVALAEGSAVITVSFAGDDKYAAAEDKTIEVTVNLKDASVSVNNETVDLFVDDTFTIVPTTTPEGLNVTYVQDDSGVYSVDNNGVVTALKEGTGSVLVKVGGDGVYAENSTTVTVTVSKIPTEILVQNNTWYMEVGDIAEGNATLTPADAGNLTYASMSPSVIKVENDKLVAVAEGKATVVIMFNGDDKYSPANSIFVTVIVSKVPTEILIQNDTLDMKVNDIVDPVVSLMPSNAGNLSFKVNDTNVILVNGQGSVMAVGEGTATVTVSFAGNDKYLPSNATITVTVGLNDASVTAEDMEMTVTDDATINYATTPEGLNVTFVADNSGVVSVSDDGVVTALKGGVGKITVYVGDGKVYAINSTEITVTVNKMDTILTVEDVRTVYNTTRFVVATLTDVNGTVLPGVKVKIVVGDLTEIAETDTNGQVSLDITTLEPGEYAIRARSSGINGIYSESKAFAHATVYPEKLNTTLTVSDVYVIGNSSGVVVATLKDDEGKALSDIKVKIVVGDLSVIALTDANGQVSLDISGLAPGEYKISARSSGVNDLYKEAKATAKAVVSEDKLDATLTVPDVYVIGDSSGVVVATLTDSEGKAISDVNVKIVVDKLSVTAKTDANGQVSLDISGLAPGEYKISARSSGVNYIYKEAKATAKAIVSEEKLDATLTVPDVVIVGNSSGAVVATLKDSYGNLISGVNVKLVIGDLTVTAKTDENGQVSVDVSDLAPGVYKVSARSSGVSDIYKEAKAYAKVIVSEEKLDTTLTVPDVVVDGSSSAVVVATLKDSYNYRVSGVNVKITVGDLTKTAKTDENGQVSLDISSLAPGEYKISARSSGVSDIYNESKATAKATVNAN